MTATAVASLDAEAYATGIGAATTGHGYAVPADVAKRWAGAEARIIGVLLRGAKRVDVYSSTQRIFTEQQGLVLTAWDRGCTFPGCDFAGLVRSPSRDRIPGGGPTSVENGALLCGLHHRSFQQWGWSVQMSNGLPWWTPPR